MLTIDKCKNCGSPIFLYIFEPVHRRKLAYWTHFGDHPGCLGIERNAEPTNKDGYAFVWDTHEMH